MENKILSAANVLKEYNKLCQEVLNDNREMLLAYCKRDHKNSRNNSFVGLPSIKIKSNGSIEVAYEYEPNDDMYPNRVTILSVPPELFYNPLWNEILAEKAKEQERKEFKSQLDNNIKKISTLNSDISRLTQENERLNKLIYE